MLEILVENLPRIALYPNLKEPHMQTELLLIFNDVTDFCVKALIFFKRSTLGKQVLVFVFVHAATHASLSWSLMIRSSAVEIDTFSPKNGISRICRSAKIALAWLS